MIIPKQTVCDFCKIPIGEGVRYGQIRMPIPPSLRQDMLDYTEQELGPRIRQTPFATILDGLDNLVPVFWSVEICADCAFALIPHLRETIAEQIRTALSRAIAAKRRSVESLQNLEPEPEE